MQNFMKDLNKFLGLDQVLKFDHVEPIFPLDAWHVPVLVVAFYPLKHGQLDIRITKDVEGSLGTIRTHVKKTTQKVLHTLQVGSMFRGYKNPNAQPSLRYEIVEWIEFQEPYPTYRKPDDHGLWVDYNDLLARINIQHWVEECGVKEIWLWSYAGEAKGWESNMAGPYGDISNSNRDLNDMPMLNNTYTLYHYNYQRGPSEATEDHMHQIEAVLRHIDSHLFWDLFVGKTREGRCGWSHYPPNAVRDYDWGNFESILTDIEDWKPDGTGQKQNINSRRWGRDSLTWFTYWMQSIPGRDNGLFFEGKPLTNWWRFIGDFDNALSEEMGLYETGGRPHPKVGRTSELP